MDPLSVMVESAAAQLVCVCGVSADKHMGMDHAFIEKRAAYDPSTWLRAARYADEGLNPATPLYITVEDRFRLALISSLAGVEVDVTARLQRPDGQVIPIRMQFFPTLSVLVQNFDFDLAEGFLLDISVLTPTAGVRVGAVFAVAQIIRQAGANAIPSRTILSNYVSSGNVIGWPEGPNQQSVQGSGVPVSLQQANPAPGADWTFTIPTANRLLVQSISAQLVTSVAVANRQPHFQEADAAGHVLWDVAASAVQAASITVRYSLAGGVTGAVNDNSAIVPIPQVAQLLQGWTIKSVTTAIQAADQWQNIWVNAIEWAEL